MVDTLVPDVVGTEYSVQGISKYVAFEAQNLIVMQILGRAHGVRPRNSRTRNPLNNEPHFTYEVSAVRAHADSRIEGLYLYGILPR